MKTFTNSNKRLLFYLTILIWVSPNHLFGQTNKKASFNLMESGINSLTFEKKGQLKVAYILPTQQQASSIQIGYSPLNKVSVDLGVKHGNLRYSGPHGFVIDKGINLYAGGGFYHTIRLNQAIKNKHASLKGHKNALNFLFNFGYAVGKLDSRIERIATNFTYTKSFYQLGIGYQAKIWRIDFFSKIYSLNFKKGSVARIFSSPELASQVQTIQRESEFKMKNNKIQLSCGFGYANFILGLSFDKSREESETYDFLTENNPYFGFSIDLNKFHKQIRAKF